MNRIHGHVNSRRLGFKIIFERRLVLKCKDILYRAMQALGSRRIQHWSLRDSGPCIVRTSPFLYGARSEIWYRRRHNDAVDTRSLSLRHTNQAI